MVDSAGREQIDGAGKARELVGTGSHFSGNAVQKLVGTRAVFWFAPSAPLDLSHQPRRRVFIAWRKTAKKRTVAKLYAIKAELRRRMHEPVADVGRWLRRVVNGYYRYHAVPGNLDRLSVFGQRLRPTQAPPRG